MSNTSMTMIHTDFADPFLGGKMFSLSLMLTQSGVKFVTCIVLGLPRLLRYYVMYLLHTVSRLSCFIQWFTVYCRIILIVHDRLWISLYLMCSSFLLYLVDGMVLCTFKGAMKAGAHNGCTVSHRLEKKFLSIRLPFNSCNYTTFT